MIIARARDDLGLDVEVATRYIARATAAGGGFDSDGTVIVVRRAADESD
jgi:hypothetical protein